MPISKLTYLDDDRYKSFS